MGESRRTVGGGHAHVDKAIQIIELAPGHLAPQQLHAADNPGQHVIQVVGNAPGELSDGFHFLRVAHVVVMLQGFLDATIYFQINGLQRVLNEVVTFAEAVGAIPGGVLLFACAQRVF